MNHDPSVYDETFFRAWETFADSIALLFKAAESDETDRPIATAQTRYVLANMALADLFKRIGQVELADRFHLLAEALNDLVEGIPHSLFSIEQPAKAGRRPDTSSVWRVRANLVVGMEYLLASGLSVDDATKHVAKKHRSQLKKLQRPGADLQKSLATRIKSFAADEVSNDVALGAYKHGMKLLEDNKLSHPPLAIRRVGEKLVETAADRAENGI